MSDIDVLKGDFGAFEHKFDVEILSKKMFENFTRHQI